MPAQNLRMSLIILCYAGNYSDSEFSLLPAFSMNAGNKLNACKGMFHVTKSPPHSLSSWLIKLMNPAMRHIPGMDSKLQGDLLRGTPGFDVFRWEKQLIH